MGDLTPNEHAWLLQGLDFLQFSDVEDLDEAKEKMRANEIVGFIKEYEEHYADGSK